MDLTKIVRAYLGTLSDAATGYKAIILDKDTMRVASTLFGRSEFAEHNVVHVEKLEDQETHKEHTELKAVCFLRPTRENITMLKRELRQPRYQQYHLFFTNLVSSIFLQELAEADAGREQIQEVQEYYADFAVLDSHHFTIPSPKNALLLSPKASGTTSAEYELIDRFVQGLSALFLAVRRRPVIRYQRGSEVAHRLADSLYSLTYKQQYQVFDFGSRSTPVVLLLDRKDDPVTPLLTQWTYQAMVHELVGIKDNTVQLPNALPTDPFKELVLDQSDDFFKRHRHHNYGEVGSSVKALVEQFQTKSEKHRQVESLADMQRFVMEHTDFQKVQGNVSKHVALMSELSEIIGKRNLMELSMAEQDLANPAAALTAASSHEELMRLLRVPGVADKDRVRLVMLYTLRFEGDALRVRQLMEFLVTAGVRDREPKLFGAIEAVVRYAGASRRAGDLYAGRSILSKARNAFKGLQGVENVYTQHTPLLTETLNQLSADRLDVAAYPYLTASAEEAMGAQAAFKRVPPREVIIFIIGGTTYEEAKAVADWNEKAAAAAVPGGPPHCRVILGGSAVLNSEAFLAALTAGSDAGL
ncbi:MAG: hypothetical protein WDW36_008770 [Sanguina aurantia]